VVVGGVAAIRHGSRRTTRDLDIVPEPTVGNYRRLAAALRELDAHVRAVDAHLLDIDPTVPRSWPVVPTSLWRRRPGCSMCCRSWSPSTTGVCAPGRCPPGSAPNRSTWRTSTTWSP
jgi:hypothetical protein